MVALEIPESDIEKSLDENPNKIQCQLCDNECHPGSKYQIFIVSLSTCTNALLCDKIHIPNLDIPKLDINFTAIPGKTDELRIHPKECCYGAHCGFETSADPIERYQKCGWDVTFKSMPRHERIDTNTTTGEKVKNCIHACPEEYKQEGKVTWMDFQKVAWSEEKASGDGDDYDDDDGVKFQVEWLPLEGSESEFFEENDLEY